jgi:hypothetical protein
MPLCGCRCSDDVVAMIVNFELSPRVNWASAPSSGRKTSLNSMSTHVNSKVSIKPINTQAFICQLFVHTIRGKTLTIQVRTPSDTACTVKGKVQDKHGQVLGTFSHQISHCNNPRSARQTIGFQCVCSRNELYETVVKPSCFCPGQVLRFLVFLATYCRGRLAILFVLASQAYETDARRGLSSC